MITATRHSAARDGVVPAALSRRADLSEFASLVLDVAESIPPGRVMSYGDIAECLGQGGPRQVGRVMALWGGGVPWWRVVHADGRLLRGHESEAIERYRREGTPLRSSANGGPYRLDMSRARFPGEPHGPAPRASRQTRG